MAKLELVGCIFCSEKGSGEHINSSLDRRNVASPNWSSRVPTLAGYTDFSGAILNQVQAYFNSYKAKRANKFIAYFQNFTNTYDSIQNLKSKYDSALIDNRIVALAIATRPDCINDDIAQLLKSYTEKYYVWVELGLQTSNDKTGDLINRGYKSCEFTKAVSILNKYNIDVVVHIMVGLPQETNEDLINTINFLNAHNIQGLKIHSCYVVENTVLANMYKTGLYTPIELNYYLESVVYILTHISPNIIIHRVSGDAPKNLLLAPNWNLHKKWIINGLDKLLREKNLWQGMYYG